ncbi:hypothetical protein FocTR4_00009222 [Fusarium oxysporum f. sp. cubense]|uniref:Uncharacterized protein n=1 Tax=Fusarium oxysporum f. sp. cubense TaxID=61366 RepID=A0A5C6SR75_FUSOC|nr:hypothetical protein FocTR4_00009222 [Fusarium oxysporum f. sp. cubense]
MAELLGIVAGGAGLASLALQLVDGGQKLRHRYKNAKGMEGNVLWLSEDIELIGKQLIQLEASADDIMQEQLGPIMMGRCRDRSAKVADRLANLAGDLPIETVVDFDAPGFVILGKLASEEIGWTTAEAMYKDLYKSCPGFVNQLASNGSEFRDFDLMEEPEILANLIQLFVRSFRTKETTHSVGTLGCDFKNVVPTWEAQPLTHIFQPDPFDFRFMKLFLKTNPDFGDSPPLHASILFDSDVNFKLCLERVAQPFEKIVNFLGQSALHKGVCQPSRVAQLLAAGHPVDLSDKNGITPLMYAASMNVPETVMMLVENGAKLFITGENDVTVLDLVAMRGNWDLIRQIVDFAAASYPGLVPKLFGSLLPLLEPANDERCYAAHDSSGLKGCIKFWSRVISTLGSPNFYFNDGTTLMHMPVDSRSARALIELGFTEFKQEDGALLEHLGSLHDLSLFRFAVANGGDEHLHNDWGWDILSAVLDGLTTHSRKDLPEVLGILQFLLDRGVQVLSRDGCVCNCSAGGCMPGLCSLPIESNLRLFAWLEILEKKRNVEEAKEFSLALLRQMCFDQADTDNDRFWDIPEQISIEETNQEMEVLAAKAYSELKIEVMVRLRRIWRKEYAKQWPGPRLTPRFRRNVQNNSARSLNGLLKEIRTSKQPKIPEPLSTSWECIVQKKLKSNHWMLRFDLELAVVEFGVDLYRCGGGQFENWLPLLTQLTDVLLAEEPGASES